MTQYGPKGDSCMSIRLSGRKARSKNVRYAIPATADERAMVRFFKIDDAYTDSAGAAGLLGEMAFRRGVEQAVQATLTAMQSGMSLGELQVWLEDLHDWRLRYKLGRERLYTPMPRPRSRRFQ